MKKYWPILIIILILAIGIVVINTAFKEEDKPVNDQNNQTSNSNNPSSSSEGEVKIEELSAGSGAEAKAGDTLSVYYTGTLQDGTQFDSNVGKETFEFSLGAGEVIAGWDQGLVGVKQGGKYKLTIPADLAYGEAGSGSIPPNSTLVFEVEVVKIEAGN